MNSNILDTILKERSFKNEKSLAITRLIIFFIPSAVDFLSFIGFSSLTLFKPTLLSLFINSLLLSISLITLILLYKKIYNESIKLFIIVCDYSIIAFALNFDPTIPREGSLPYWTSFSAAIFLFVLNLLRYSKFTTIFSGIMSLLLYIGICYNLPSDANVDLPRMIVVLIIFIFIGYLITDSNMKMMKEANTKTLMERYLPPQLVNELYNKNANIEPGGKNQIVTILFSDIRNFTSISEKISASEVVSFLNLYLSKMTEVIYSQNGTIDKFIGDAILTIFGAPIQNEDDSIRAIHTALNMQKNLKNLNKEKLFFEKEIKMGIGIHTGEVIAGNIGSDKRLDYTIIGDNVNLCSRIESLTKFYPCSILISESTLQSIQNLSKDEFLIREVDTVIVKGKTKPIKLFEVLDYSNELEKEKIENLINEFTNGLNFYKEKKFNESLNIFSKLTYDELSKFYIERIKGFQKNPPLEWNGVYTLDHK